MNYEVALFLRKISPELDRMIHREPEAPAGEPQSPELIKMAMQMGYIQAVNEVLQILKAAAKESGE